MFSIVCLLAKVLQSYLTFFVTLRTEAHQASVCGILQARILEWVAMPSPQGIFPTHNEPLSHYVFCTGRQVLHHWGHLGSPASNKWCHTATCRRTELDSYLTSHTKVNSKRIKNLNVKSESIKSLEGNRGQAS